MSLNSTETAQPTEPEYYTVDDVAAKLQVNRFTVYALVKSGQLRSVKITRDSGRAAKTGRSGTIRIPREYLAEYEARLRDGA
jgi:excisionase family DNA binding protein